MRSKLFVPASRPELFLKALASDADALSFDLEDAVVESRKAEARNHLRAFLLSDDAKASGKTLIVRVNPADSLHFEADLQAVLTPRLDMLNLPKAGSAAQVRAVGVRMAALEAPAGIAAPVRLLLNIETPAAMRQAADLAGADPRVAGLQLGLGDLFEPLAISRANQAAIDAAMFQVRMAAGEAGIFVCDSAFADTSDGDGYRAEAQRARDFGCIGKSCIHPRQIAIANDVFRPSQGEIAHARKVVESIAQASASGVGAYLVDGRMIDPPFIQRAQAIVAQARALGLLCQAAGERS